MTDILKQLEKINIIKRKQKRHDINILESGKKQLNIVISNYAKNKFDLVIDKNSKIIHSKSGFSLDITKAILDDINSSSIQITIPAVPRQPGSNVVEIII